MTKLIEFTADETDRLGRTADALSAYMGKPVLAEIVAEPEPGFEWALFAIPLQPGEDVGERAIVQVGGPKARFAGSGGGLDLADGQALECEFLWAIQLSDLEGVRYIKVDAEGEEVGWSDRLEDLLPFDLRDAHPPAGGRDEDGEDETLARP